MKYSILLLSMGVFLAVNINLLYADDLEIKPDVDAYMKLATDGEGFHLYIRALPGRKSVIITESSADPLKKTDSFTLRAWDYNPVNGDEKRILNGKFLESGQPLYFLLDSTPEPNTFLGSAFHIYVPFLLTYGYPWSREGQIEVSRGTWLNIRTFELPYADYSGAWRDNPFRLSMRIMPPPPEPKEVKIEAGPVDNVEEAVERISQIIDNASGSIDIVLAVDTTISMKDDIGFIRTALVPLVRESIANYDTFRVGLVMYRDYKEAYLTRVGSPFTDNLNELQLSLNRITTNGGRDLPEAVHEGIYAALTEFDWQAPQRVIIQVGDAPPHDIPRGDITAATVEDEAKRLGVEIYPIHLPSKK